MAEITNVNYEQLFNKSGFGARTIIATLTKDSGSATEAELVTLIQAIENAGGDGTGTDTDGPDAFTVAGFYAATLGTDPAYVALQGTGTLGTSSGDYVTGFTVTTVADFPAN